MEGGDQAFTAEEIAQNTGYPLKGTVKAKISRNEWKNVLVRLGPNKFKAKPVGHLSRDQFVQRLSVKDMHEQPEITLSGKLCGKSIQAAISAIEIYNKPDFKYREESFAILMVNAWELLLKARVAADNGEREESLIQLEKNDHGKLVPELSRSGNPRTITIGKAIGAVSLDQALKDHLFALIEIRDNAIHLMNDSPMLKLKVQEVGTASLRNYLELVKEWFSIDLSRFNFYLMPMSFFHPHELESYSVNSEPVQNQNLLRYVNNLETEHHKRPDERFSISLTLETKFVKSKLRFDPNDPKAVAVRFESEEAFRNKYKWRYQEDLLPQLRKRYSDFKIDQKFHRLKERFRKNPKYAGQRSLDWENPKSQKKWFYCSEILKEFDQHYNRRK